MRLDRDEEVYESLKKFANDEDIKGAYFFGIGSAKEVELGFYDLQKKEFSWADDKQTLEITGLQGNIAWDGDKPAIHIHGTFSDSENKVEGGHVKKLVVGATCELFIHAWFKNQKLTRTENTDTGLKLLDL